jgi:hypothetical protein
MCTISIATSRDGGAVRLLMNRDERRLRPIARPPAVHSTTTGSGVWPVDPSSGGTWVAATDAGLALAVLNVDGHRRTSSLLSRGLVIPMLAGCRSVAEVVERWSTLDTSVFAPFRLLAVSRDLVAECSPFTDAPAIGPLRRAQLFASSSLGDAEVEPLRAALFGRILMQDRDPWLAQTRLHQHAWPDRRDVSVMMSRVDACTVSQTEILLSRDEASLTYRPVVEGWPVGGTRLTLRCAPSAASRAA